MIEIFKDIEEYKGLYKISNMGNVLSLGNGNSNNSKERILKPAKNKDGYLMVNLCKQGKRKMYRVHRLVAQTFIPNPYNLPEVNHIDEDKTNNYINNLEWCDKIHNCNYGTRNKRVAEKLSKQVLCVETGKIYASTHQVEIELELSQGNISSVCNGIRNTCGGFHWRYVIL